MTVFIFDIVSYVQKTLYQKGFLKGSCSQTSKNKPLVFTEKIKKYEDF